MLGVAADLPLEAAGLGLGTDRCPVDLLTTLQTLWPHVGLGLVWLEVVLLLWKMDCGARAGSLCPSNAIQASSKLKQGFGNAGEMYCRRLHVLTSSIDLRNVWPSAPEPFLV